MTRIRWKYLVSAKARAIRRADTARDEGRPGDAVDLYRTVLKKWGGSFGLLMQLGNALKDSGSYSEAERAYLEALLLRPEHADVFLQRGHLMKLAGDKERAAEYYSKAKLLDPGSDDAQRELEQLLGYRVTAMETQRGSAVPGGPIMFRPDLSAVTGVNFLRLVNQYRWRRG